ncbi:MAG TPA: alpha/beta hydrolase [Thermoleophilaceae bacterium]|nr:alpha/beta hydrolase [Thermoleophilaceae bacterium]
MKPREFQVLRQIPGGGSLTLAGEEVGDGTPIVLAHGLSATRRNVVQGSRHLARRGYRLISYDARGHGASSPAPDPAAYEYSNLVGDLEAVLADLELERPVLVGSSMGAATVMTYALEHSDRVPALVQITPAYNGAGRTAEPVESDDWEKLATALDEGGVERFVEVAQPDDLPERWREVSKEATRQRLERHENIEAVAAALRVVPYSQAFDGLDELESLEVPTLVVGARDEADWLHPLEIAEEYARRLPRGELVVEDDDEPPIAWQGARLSGVIGDFLERNGVAPQP